MSDYDVLLDNELIKRLKAAHDVLIVIHEHYGHVNQLKEEAAKCFADIARRKKMYYAVAILLIFVAFPFGLIGTAFTFYLYNKRKKETEAYGEQCDTAASKEEVVAEQYIIDNKDTLSVLPNDYWYPMATENIIKILQQGRASTLNEAMDRFDALRREWLMDQRYAEMSAAIMQQSSNLESIERSSRINTAINVGRAVADVTRGVGRGVGRFFDNIG